jgi:hypothetical protein
MTAGDNRNEAVLTGRLRVVDRVVTISVLFSLLVKLSFFIIGFKVYVQMPLRDGFFPPILQSSIFLLLLYVMAATLTTASLLIGSRVGLLAVRIVLLALLFGLCIHQQSYNDVTFVTCFWTVAWSTWLVFAMRGRGERELLEIGATFSHLILAMIFFGAAVGKLTPGYWNGDVLYGIYFESRSYWTFDLARSAFDDDGLRKLACVYSRIVIVSEFVCSLIWLMPLRLGSTVALVTTIGIALLNNLSLFSVVSCLIGLSLVGLMVPREKTVEGITAT